MGSFSFGVGELGAVVVEDLLGRFSLVVSIRGGGRVILRSALVSGLWKDLFQVSRWSSMKDQFSPMILWSPVEGSMLIRLGSLDAIIG